MVTFLFVTFSSVGILLFERSPGGNIHTAEDALWWSVTTITTVGYGDKYPVTTEGRVLAMALMFSGVGLFGTFSGIIASLFLGKVVAEEDEILAEVRALRAEPCPWPRNPLDLAYHDTEWGVPLHDDRALFELLILEGAQAGLSWSTVLAKRENYRQAFDGFDAEKIARYDAKKVAALLADAGIVRNRLKIAATIGNARAYLQLHAEPGGFD
eukprot:gene9646-11836_t